MSVPSTAYRTIPLTGVNNSGAAHHLRAILQVSDAYMKSTFFLDELFPCVDEAGNLGVVGIVYPGTDNYNKHNPSRHGALRISPDGILLNDGGLNTKGKADAPVAVNLLYTYIRIRSRWFSSYYSATSAYGFEWERLNGSTTESGLIGKGSLPAAGSDTTDTPELLPTIPDTLPGNLLKVRSFIVNEEGTGYSDWINFTLVNRFEVRRASNPDGPGTTPYAGCLLNSSSPQFYVFIAAKNFPPIGSPVWLDEAGTIPALDGSYAYRPDDAIEDYYFYSVGGQVVSYRRCPEQILISLWAEPENPNAGMSRIKIFASPDSFPNTTQLITGLVRVGVEGVSGTTYTTHEYSMEMSLSASVTEDYLRDSLGDPMEFLNADYNQSTILSANLQYRYVENEIFGIDREVYYNDPQFS